jgi:hypothetical protein
MCIKARLVNFVWELGVAFIGVPVAILVYAIMVVLAVVVLPISLVVEGALYAIRDWAYRDCE